MKKYCISEHGKNQIKEGLAFLAIMFILFIGAFTFIFMLFVFDINPNKDLIDRIIYIWGSIGWAITLSAGLIGIKRWLTKNIVEC